MPKNEKPAPGIPGQRAKKEPNLHLNTLRWASNAQIVDWLELLIANGVDNFAAIATRVRRASDEEVVGRVSYLLAHHAQNGRGKKRWRRSPSGTYSLVGGDHGG